MRLIGEIPHPDCKITIFWWNNRYLVKFEVGLFEQTYKLNQYDLTEERELYTLVDTEFITRVLEIFDQMGQSFQGAMQRL